ncbi:MAG: hypothetical protein KAR87_03690 [Candidatus Aenigmarchaeota archaeon]|nr:hypothetical protein [Candidatus Aenigmarchaeota archaeon]
MCSENKEAEIYSKVLKSIKKSGFPLELKISNIFLKNGWGVEYNNYFIDHDLKKGREIDLIADYTKMTDSNEYLELDFKLIIEIKQAETPWIFISTPSTDFEKFLGFPVIRQEKNFKENVYLSFRNNQKVNGRLARSFFVGLKSNKRGNTKKDKIFEALCKVVKALEHSYESSYIKEIKKNHKDKLLEYYEPIIVVDGKLFEAYLDSKEELILKKTEYMQVSFNYLSPNYKNRQNGYMVQVMTKNYLTEFLNKRHKEFDIVANKILRIESKHEEFIKRG